MSLLANQGISCKSAVILWQMFTIIVTIRAYKTYTVHLLPFLIYATRIHCLQVVNMATFLYWLEPMSTWAYVLAQMEQHIFIMLVPNINAYLVLKVGGKNNREYASTHVVEGECLSLKDVQPKESDWLTVNRLTASVVITQPGTTACCHSPPFRLSIWTHIRTHINTVIPPPCWWEKLQQSSVGLVSVVLWWWWIQCERKVTITKTSKIQHLSAFTIRSYHLIVLN